jgi:hypothetical protein
MTSIGVGSVGRCGLYPIALGHVRARRYVCNVNLTGRMSGCWERPPVPLTGYTDGGMGTSVDGCLTCGVAIPGSHYRTVLVMAKHLLTSAALAGARWRRTLAVVPAR